MQLTVEMIERQEALLRENNSCGPLDREVVEAALRVTKDTLKAAAERMSESPAEDPAPVPPAKEKRGK